MKRALVAAFAFAVVVWASVPAVKRDALAQVEKDFKTTLESTQVEILGWPQGVYLDDFGAVFTSDVILAYTPTLNPFHLTITPAEKEKILKSKLDRVPILKRNMQQLLLNASATLSTLPANEQIVVAVAVTNYQWELTDGLPTQIQMRGVRSKLMEAKAGKVPAESVVRVQEQ